MASTTLPKNYWRDDKCAKAFWSQDEMPAYRQLMDDTEAWLEPQPGERWLDLGCGAGRLSRLLWTMSEGQIAEVTGLDCAPLNAKSYDAMRASLLPPPGDKLRFAPVDFSGGLVDFATGRYDGVVSGLAIQYAESLEGDRWTDAGYDRLLSETFRVLRPGGRFVFSVNVPNPSWGRVALHAIRRIGSEPRKLRYLKKLLRMWSYGGWLKREARKGRFHFLSAEAVTAKLTAAGFVAIEHRVSFAGQAYLFRSTKP